MKPVRLNDLSPDELKQITTEKPLILIPLGTTEWHAGHLPLGVDSLLSQAICEEISSRTGCVIAPTLSCGICRNLEPGKGFFGTVDTIQVDTLSNLLIELGNGYAGLGFKKAVVLSGHGETDHFKALDLASARSERLEMILLSAFDFTKEKIVELDDAEKTWPFALDHAAEWETSMMLHYFPDLVQMEKAPETIELDMPGVPDYIRKRYPRRASREYGDELAAAVIEGGVNKISRLIQMEQKS